MPPPPLRQLLGTTALQWGQRPNVGNVDIANARQLRGAVRRLRRHLNDDVAAVLVRGSLVVKASGAPSILHFTRAGALPAQPHAPYDFVTVLLQAVAAGRGKSNYQRQVVSTRQPSVMARGMEAIILGHGNGILDAAADDPGDPDEAPADEIAAWYRANTAAGTIVEVPPTAVTQRDLTRFAVPHVPPPHAVNLLRDAAPLDLTLEGGGAAGYEKVHRVYMLAAFALLKAHGEVDAADGKFVAALLVSRDGRVLSWGLNTNKANATHHAEVNMLQAHHAAHQPALGAYAGVPAHSRIYTTLQCCKMCAGMIRHCASDPASIRVYFGVPDPGQNDNTSALQGAAPLERRLVTTPGIAGVEFIWSKRMHAADGEGTDYSTRLERRMAREKGDAASQGAGIARAMEQFSAHEELARKYHKYHRAPDAPVAAHFARHESAVRNPQTRDAVRYAVAFLASLGID